MQEAQADELSRLHSKILSEKKAAEAKQSSERSWSGQMAESLSKLSGRLSRGSFTQ